MMTAMLTVRNIQAGRRAYDIWAVNEDAEYHEVRRRGRRGGARVRAARSEAAEGGLSLMLDQLYTRYVGASVVSLGVDFAIFMAALSLGVPPALAAATWLYRRHRLPLVDLQPIRVRRADRRERVRRARNSRRLFVLSALWWGSESPRRLSASGSRFGFDPRARQGGRDRRQLPGDLRPPQESRVRMTGEAAPKLGSRRRGGSCLRSVLVVGAMMIRNAIPAIAEWTFPDPDDAMRLHAGARLARGPELVRRHSVPAQSAGGRADALVAAGRHPDRRGDADRAAVRRPAWRGDCGADRGSARDALHCDAARPSHRLQADRNSGGACSPCLRRPLRSAR